jgi:hypothetical protein
MARELDLEKRREWEERLRQFRASGLTVARFCASQGLSVNTFYYWSKRVAKPGTTARSAARQPPAAGVHQSERGAGTASTASGGLVHFRLAAGIEVSVPAHCLDVIRCLAESVPRAGAAARARVGGEAFQAVVLGSREALTES